MISEVALHHIALQVSDREKAELFFTKVLDIPKVKSFSLSHDLASTIFGIQETVEIDVYDNGVSRFELFITSPLSSHGFCHSCIDVPSIKDLLKKCRAYGVRSKVVKKGEKDLFFIWDFSGNLYEIKQS